MNYSDLKYDIEEFESDQDKKLPQPPLVKAAMRKDSIELLKILTHYPFILTF